jgi:hypothetical protein
VPDDLPPRSVETAKIRSTRIWLPPGIGVVDGISSAALPQRHPDWAERFATLPSANQQQFSLTRLSFNPWRPSQQRRSSA